MRNLFIGLSIFLIILGLILTYLPLEQFACIPLGLAFIFLFLAIVLSDLSKRKLPVIIIVICVIASSLTIFKIYNSKDIVAKDAQFEQKKIESKQEDLKDLEGLE